MDNDDDPRRIKKESQRMDAQTWFLFILCVILVIGSYTAFCFGIFTP
jgi:hypothetical protein